MGFNIKNKAIWWMGVVRSQTFQSGIKRKHFMESSNSTEYLESGDCGQVSIKLLSH
jgi:hypothetical protein